MIPHVLIVALCLSLSACATQQKQNSASAQTKSNTNSTTATSEGPLETFMQGCETELDTYCKDVTPGDGRILACIYAHNDKLSGHCEYALYDSAQQLENAVAALAYLATKNPTDK